MYNQQPNLVLRGFKFQGNFSSQSRPEFNVGAIPASAYPGLDEHPRRITPIPISEGQFQPDEIWEGYGQVAKTIFWRENS